MQPLLKQQVSHAVTMDLVKQAAALWDVDPTRLTHRERTHEVSHPRFAIVFALRHMAKIDDHAAVMFTVRRLAPLLGFTDHTSVSYAHRRAIEMYGKDMDFTVRASKLISTATKALRETFEVEA